MQLTNGIRVITVTNPDEIAEAIRKGWVETVPPAHDPATHHAPEWVSGAWVEQPLTPEELAARARKTWPNAAAFLDEFTMPELAAISLSVDPTIAALRLLLASWPSDVWSDDPRIVIGLAAIVSAGIIDETRSAEIVAK